MNWRLMRGVGAAAVAFVAMASPGLALVVGGGGPAASDCLAVFNAPANTPAAKPRNVKCIDGDPTCDADGLVNGSCEIPVSVCANSTALSSCTLNGVESITVDHSADNGDPKFDPEFQALQTRIESGINPPSQNADDCTLPTNFHVLISGPFKTAAGANQCKPTTKTLKLTAVSTVIGGKVYTDKDTLTLTCVPAANGCDPQLLYAGTFDRIQTQIFDQSCALSHCHDSQTQSGGMLLEAGAASTNLIDVTPQNPAAAAMGWKRVTPGSSDVSFLYHKVTGDLPNASFGMRMPRGKPKLKSALIDVIKLWIDAGAPQTGWVSGTD